MVNQRLKDVLSREQVRKIETIIQESFWTRVTHAKINATNSDPSSLFSFLKISQSLSLI